MAIEITSAADLLDRVHTVPGGVHLLDGPNTSDYAVTLLAAAHGRCAAVPLNTRASAAEIDAVRAITAGRELPPGIYISTSGSQGEPKLVALTPDALFRHAHAVNAHLEVNTQDTWLACLPFFHVGGMAVILRCAAAGAKLCIVPRPDAETVHEQLDACTLVSLVPTVLRRLLTLRPNGLPASVRAVVLGGGPVPLDLIERCPQVLPTYGLTEAGSMVTCARPRCAESERTTAGIPLPGAAVRIVDENGHDVAEGTVGRILAQSSGAASGYIENENETARTFRAGWIQTEDAGYLDWAGCLHVVGRRDRIIVCGGENIALDEIETALRAIAPVSDALCIALDEPEWGQIPGAVIETPNAIKLAELRAALRALLAPHKLPRAVRCVTALPLLPNGKPDYVAARRLFG